MSASIPPPPPAAPPFLQRIAPAWASGWPLSVLGFAAGPPATVGIATAARAADAAATAEPPAAPEPHPVASGRQAQQQGSSAEAPAGGLGPIAEGQAEEAEGEEGAAEWEHAEWEEAEEQAEPAYARLASVPTLSAAMEPAGGSLQVRPALHAASWLGRCDGCCGPWP